MKVLSIGSDRNIFSGGSEARERIIKYGKFAEELHVIIFNSRFANHGSPFTIQKISRNTWVYPTNSKNRWFYIFDAYKIAKNIIHNSKFMIHNSLITCQDPFESGFAGWLIKRKFKIPLQLQAHTDFLSPYFRKESWLNKIRVLIAKFLVCRAGCIRVVSERIKNSLSRSAGCKLRFTVLPIFVDAEAIKNTPIKADLHEKYPHFDFIILMASRLTKEKNIGLAINAMAEVVKKHSKAGLIIVGDGPGRNSYSLLVTRYSLQNNVIFEDAVPFEILISYYKTADLFLLTSNYEGYGRSVVEAMAAGCAVVMTDVGLAGEILINKKDGLVVPIENGEKLKDAIISLIENKDLRENLVKNARDIFNFWPSEGDYLKKYLNCWAACKKQKTSF
ncbi:MAG: hypothetical protein A2909_01585 [Candidatus Tagabacteria bacterium RIFCSPLOWO2_01_FULL_39_11]|uniref:Uncharacterized protein n=1 Tax=Candidatus Tagabacteria bacterium RIFCSPLOWO2_01_FULL_39_11 TaxID=1802295 RepID=A0A1G2LTI4_9BACT|nr:MAG: hypothetical protein A2909_01585 [Candidatus Tagabacteria bacterium RIFCSPLOWO2_01_FULL_39_11]